MDAEALAAAVDPEGDNPFRELVQRLEDMPDSPEKEITVRMLQQLMTESEKGEEADKEAIKGLVGKVAKVLPDIAEIAINTIINPASGVTTLVQKVVENVVDDD